MPPLILLAGGKSSRMGTPKGLLKKQNHFWIEHQLKLFERAGGTHAFVVLGFDSEKYLSEIEDLRRSREQAIQLGSLSIRTLVNQDAELGQFSSIQCGVMMAQKFKSTFLLPIDVPAPDRVLWAELAQSKSYVTVPTHEGHGGHPILLSQEMMKLILESPVTSRLDQLIHDLPQTTVTRTETKDKNVIMNLNDLETWNAFQD